MPYAARVLVVEDDPETRRYYADALSRGGFETHQAHNGLQALQKAHVSVTPKSLETDVKSVISKIELGEADAGIVYATDVKAAGPKVQGVTIPAADNVIATYPIVAVKGASNAGAAAGFIAYVLSAEGQSTLVSFGFQHS